MLCLDAEQERGGEPVHVGDAVVGCGVVGGRPEVKVVVGDHDEPPDHGETCPAEEKAEGEHEQCPAPLGIHQGGEDVLGHTHTSLATTDS